MSFHKDFLQICIYLNNQPQNTVTSLEIQRYFMSVSFENI